MLLLFQEESEAGGHPIDGQEEGVIEQYLAQRRQNTGESADDKERFSYWCCRILNLSLHSIAVKPAGFRSDLISAISVNLNVLCVSVVNKR